MNNNTNNFNNNNNNPPSFTNPFHPPRYDFKTFKYLQSHRIFSLFESLLLGLMIYQPVDPSEFLLEQLRSISPIPEEEEEIDLAASSLFALFATPSSSYVGINEELDGELIDSNEVWNVATPKNTTTDTVDAVDAVDASDTTTELKNECGELVGPQETQTPNIIADHLDSIEHNQQQVDDENGRGKDIPRVLTSRRHSCDGIQSFRENVHHDHGENDMNGFRDSNEQFMRSTRPSFQDEELIGSLQLPKPRGIRRGRRSRSSLVAGTFESQEVVSGDDTSKLEWEEESELKDNNEPGKPRRNRKSKGKATSVKKGGDIQPLESASSSISSATSYSSSSSADTVLERVSSGASHSTLSPNSVFHITRGGNASSANLVADSHLNPSSDSVNSGGLTRSPSIKQSGDKLLSSSSDATGNNEPEQEPPALIKVNRFESYSLSKLPYQPKVLPQLAQPKRIQQSDYEQQLIEQQQNVTLLPVQSISHHQPLQHQLIQPIDFNTTTGPEKQVNPLSLSQENTAQLQPPPRHPQQRSLPLFLPPPVPVQSTVQYPLFPQQIPQKYRIHNSKKSSDYLLFQPNQPIQSNANAPNPTLQINPQSILSNSGNSQISPQPNLQPPVTTTTTTTLSSSSSQSQPQSTLTTASTPSQQLLPKLVHPPGDKPLDSSRSVDHPPTSLPPIFDHGHLPQLDTNNNSNSPTSHQNPLSSLKQGQLPPLQHNHTSTSTNSIPLPSNDSNSSIPQEYLFQKGHGPLRRINTPYHLSDVSDPPISQNTQTTTTHFQYPKYQYPHHSSRDLIPNDTTKSVPRKNVDELVSQSLLSDHRLSHLDSLSSSWDPSVSQNQEQQLSYITSDPGDSIARSVNKITVSSNSTSFYLTDSTALPFRGVHHHTPSRPRSPHTRKKHRASLQINAHTHCSHATRPLQNQKIGRAQSR